MLVLWRDDAAARAATWKATAKELIERYATVVPIPPVLAIGGFFVVAGGLLCGWVFMTVVGTLALEYLYQWLAG